MNRRGFFGLLASAAITAATRLYAPSAVRPVRVEQEWSFEPFARPLVRTNYDPETISELFECVPITAGTVTMIGTPENSKAARALTNAMCEASNEIYRGYGRALPGDLTIGFPTSLT